MDSFLITGLIILVILMIGLTQSAIKETYHTNLGCLIVTTLIQFSLLIIRDYDTSISFIKNLTLISIILTIQIYIVLGIIWSFFMWVQYNEFTKADTYRQWPLTNTNDEMRIKNIVLKSKPKVSDNVQRLLTWVLFWPFSLLRYYVGEYIGKLIGISYKKAAKLLTSSYNHFTKDIYKN